MIGNVNGGGTLKGGAAFMDVRAQSEQGQVRGLCRQSAGTKDAFGEGHPHNKLPQQGIFFY